MSKLFKNMNLDPRLERQALQNKYNSARINLLLAVGFTVINVLLLAFGGGSYFLFSITVPYLISMLGLLFCGKLPEDTYKEMGMEGMEFLDESFLYTTLAISALILALYVVCWVFSKKKPICMKIALGLFIVDTVALIFYNGLAIDMIMDVLFHGYVIWTLVSGINAEKKLKALPKEETVIEAEFTEISTENIEVSNQSAELKQDEEKINAIDNID